MIENNTNINWFPGHMKKSFRDLENSLKNIDCCICVLDARAPKSTTNPELEKICAGKQIIYAINKIDLANDLITKEWLDYFKSQNKIAITIDATKKSCVNVVLNAINLATKTKQDKQKLKGIFTKIRVAIVGVPNTGKSTLLNTLAGAYLSKTGNIAGVTRSSSWIKLKNNIELMDNAGTLYPKFNNINIANNLAFLGSINDDVLNKTELAKLLIQKLLIVAKTQLFQRYKLSDESCSVDDIILQIAKNRGYLVKGNQPNIKRTCDAIIDDYRKTRIGKISLERPGDLL